MRLEPHFEAVFENAEVGFLILDEKLSIVKANPAVCRYVGYSEDELKGKNVTFLIHPDDVQNVLEYHRKRLNKEPSPLSYEIRYITKSGKVRWCLVVPVLNPKIKHMVVILADITEKRETEKLFEDVFFKAPIGIFLSQDGLYKLVNPKVERELGYSQEELSRMSPMDPVHPKDRDKVKKAAHTMLKKEENTPPYEFRAIRKDGSTFWCMGTVTSTSYKGKKAVLGYLVNIEEQKKLQNQLSLEKKRAEAIIQNAPFIVLGLGENSKILLFNNFAERLTGYKKEEVIGKRWIDIFIPEELREKLYSVWNKVVESRAEFHEYENPIVTKDGERRLIKWRNTVITEEGRFLMVLSIGEDITERRKFEKELYHLSITDPLTGAYNRRYFLERLEEEVERVKRGGTPFSLIMMDLDHFKEVNDTYGHKTGDEVLRLLVNAVRDRLRKIDLFARWGGEEFLILLPNTPLENAKHLAMKIKEKIEELSCPMNVKITASFGVTEYRKGDTPDSLISRADELMYRAKRLGRNRVEAG